MHYLLSAAAKFSIGLSQAMRPHLSQIAIAISMTLLAIFGSDINAGVKGLVAKYPFIVRVGVFILVVAFGYGAASLLISYLFARALMQLDNQYLAAVVVLSFILIGVLAEHKGHI
jgi:hypothetical protein